MRIDNSNLQFGINTTEQSGQNKGISKANPDNKEVTKESTAAPVKTDAVEISSKEPQTVSIATQLKELPDVREDKVAELKAKIADGSYDVSGRDIADKIVDTAINDVF